MINKLNLYNTLNFNNNIIKHKYIYIIELLIIFINILNY